MTLRDVSRSRDLQMNSNGPKLGGKKNILGNYF